MIPNCCFHKGWQTWTLGRCSINPLESISDIFRDGRKLELWFLDLRKIHLDPTFRYHTKVRTERGFTSDELREAGLKPFLARTIIIDVDQRRINKSLEPFQRSVQRLKEYRSKLMLFPKKWSRKKLKRGEASLKEKKVATQLKKDDMPIKKISSKLKIKKMTKAGKRFSAYTALRVARADVRLVGDRAKKGKEAAENGDNLSKATKERAKRKEIKEVKGLAFKK